ncbi:MAG: sugar phosphate isomerase/epimerase [Chloroflexi bacterium]|nr:sugar phosphate isomerase/epimerase [Chloroflexota bacterium]
MRLTVATYSFEALPLEGTLAIARSMGFKGVDIAGFHQRGRCSYEPDEAGAHPQETAAALKPLLEQYGLEPVDFFPQFGASPAERSLNDPDPEVRRQNLATFRGLVRFCQLAGIPGMTVLPGVDHTSRSLEANLDASAAALRQFVDIAGEGGLGLCFEPHMGSVTDTPELALALVERVPGLKVTLDYSHFLLQYIPVERVHALIPFTGHFHIRPARPGKLQTRHIDGTLDWPDIIRRLQAAGYQGCMSVEYVYAEWYDMTNLDTLTETVVTKEALEPYISV